MITASSGAPNPSRTSLVLSTLLSLFALRVLGQLLVALGLAPALPHMEAWYSGLMPYPPLLAMQVLILVLGLFVIRGVRDRRGFLGRPNRRLGTALTVFGSLYLFAMVVRYILTMAFHPDLRWTGHTIPIFFHIVLACFVLALARHHRRTYA